MKPEPVDRSNAQARTEAAQMTAATLEHRSYDGARLARLAALKAKHAALRERLQGRRAR